MERFLGLNLEKEKKLTPLYLNHSLRAVAVTLLSFFSSIYIYKTLLRLTGKENLGLLAVFTFYFGLYSFKFLANLIAENLSISWGLKKQMYLGSIFAILCMFALFLSPRWPYLIIVASPLWGLYAGFYWYSQHAIMAKSGQIGTFGREIGVMEVLRILSLLGVPLLGGFLITFAGYHFLFAAALIFVLFSILTISFFPEQIVHHDTSLSEIFRLFKSHKRTVLVYAGNTAAATIYGITFPLYLFLILGRELSLGEFFSSVMILVALISFVIGRRTDLGGKKGLMVLGSVFAFFVWIGRFLTQSIKLLFIFDIMDRLTAGMVGIPLTALSYEKAVGGHSTGRATLFREVAITISEILSCLLLIVMVLLKMPLKFAFLFAAVLSLLVAWGAKNGHKE